MFPIEILTVETKSAKIDKNFNFRSHISGICSSCIYHIRDLRHIRRHLDLESTKLLANARVSSRLDYCNSLLSGIAEIDLTKLQRILNLHWLPVRYRVHFKIWLLTYKILHEEQPVYLPSLIATSLPSRSQRSSRGITLTVLGSRPTLAQGHSAPAALLFWTPCHYLPA